MKNIILNIVFVGLFFVGTYSCKKDNDTQYSTNLSLLQHTWYPISTQIIFENGDTFTLIPFVTVTFPLME